MYLRLGNSKLGTARRANKIRLLQQTLGTFLLDLVWIRGVQRRGRGSREQIPPDLVGDVGVDTVGFFTAGVPVAAKVDVAILLDEAQVQGSHGVYVVVERGIDVPGFEEAGAVGVKEGDGRREGIVEVNYVGKVGHGFVAFIRRGFKNCVVRSCVGGRVDDVDCSLPARAVDVRVLVLTGI